MRPTTERRITRGAVAAAIALGWAALAPTGATAAPAGAAPPALVASALPGSVSVIPQCDGEAIVQRSGGLLKIERPNNTSGTLMVNVTYSGSLVGTDDLGPLPDPVEIPVGETSAIIPVEASAPGDVTVTIDAGDGYSIGEPASATSDIADSGGAFGCQAEVVETIDVGTSPAALPIYDQFGFGVGDSSLQIDGELPPGLTYNIDGSWTGAATTLGTYEFTACYAIGDFCGLEIPFRITVVEVSADDPVLPPAAPPAAPVTSDPSYTG